MAVVAVAISAAWSWAAGSGLTAVVGRLLLSTAVSAISSAIQKQLSKPSPPGIKSEYTTDGGTRPMSFVMGWYATDGHMVCPPMSHGRARRTSNAYLTYVIALGDVPGMQIDKVIIDDTEVEFESAPEVILQGGAVPTDRPAWWYEQQGISPTTPNAPTSDRPEITPGQPVKGDKYGGKIWLRYHDGHQTEADPYLMQVYGSGTAWANSSERPWTADMVGTGTCYAVLTFRHDTKAFNGLPRCRFVMRGIPLYDPRKDSSAGGTGPQRWEDRATWTSSTNAMVLAYNVLRGIPIEGGPLWGYGVSAAGLPLTAWAPVMNAADQVVDGKPRWQASWEVSVDEQPAAVLDEILKVCCAEVAESGGVWKPRIGPDGPPVYVLTDDDLILDKDASAAPFPGLESTYNGVHANYPEPKALWRPKDAPPRYNAGWEAADQGRRLVAELNLPACPWDGQIQRVMRAYIEEERRFRRHVVPLPPEAEALEVFDVIAWTSAEHGYDAKLFRVVEVGEDPETLLTTVSLREIDPADYDWRPDYRLPSTVPSVVRPNPEPVSPSYFSVAGISLSDAEGRPRRAALQLRWGGWALDGIDSLQWEVRRVGATDTMRGVMGNPEAGEVVVSGLVPTTAYEARVSFMSRSGTPVAWSAWTTATTPAVLTPVADIDTTPPARPSAVNLSSTPGTLTATWTDPAADGVSYSDLEITEAGGNPVVFQTSGHRYRWAAVLPGVAYTVRRRAVDGLGNRSVWSDPATHTVARDTIPPAAPTGLTVTGTFGAFVLRWNRNLESDFAFYELAMGTTTAPTGVIATPISVNFTLGDQPADATRHFRVRAVDTSGNRSGWSATVSGKTLASALTTITTEALTGLIDTTSFATGVQPIRIWSGASLPAAYQGDVLAWRGALYRWAGEAYVKDILAPGGVQTAHLDAGVVTAQKLGIGFGGNLITNSDFLAGTTGWGVFKAGSSGPGTSFGVQPPGVWAGPDYPTLRIQQSDAETGGRADLLFLGVRDTSGTAGHGWPVKPGDWIEASVQLSTHRCTAALRIEWRDAAGTAITWTPPVDQASEAGSSTNPDLWSRIWTKGMAPAGAAYAVFHLRKLPTASGANSFVFVHKPMLASSAAERTELTPYAPGSFTLMDGAGLLTDSVTARAVNAVDLAVNGLAHLNVAYIREANITGTLTAAILRGGTGLLGTLTVNGTALGTISDRAADPAARINAASTRVDPGRIMISGSRTLADWRMGGDTGLFDGGNIAVNTVRANALELGSRNVAVENIAFTYNDPAPDRVSWSGGSISYPDDDGTTFAANIPAGSGPVWTGGLQYVVFTKGGAALWVTSSRAVAFRPDVLILATYGGGARLNGHYGRVLIDHWGVRADNLLIRSAAQIQELILGTALIAPNAITRMVSLSSQQVVNVGRGLGKWVYQYPPNAAPGSDGTTETRAQYYDYLTASISAPSLYDLYFWISLTGGDVVASIFRNNATAAYNGWAHRAVLDSHTWHSYNSGAISGVIPSISGTQSLTLGYAGIHSSEWTSAANSTITLMAVMK